MTHADGQVWRERLERWFTPIARRSPLSANQITLLAFLLNVSAAVVMTLSYRDPRGWLLAPLLVAVAGLLDGLDGIVARVRGTSSRWGDFLDHTLDRASDTALLIGWVLGTRQRVWLALLVVVGAMFVGYVGTQTEASFRKRSYKEIGRGEYVLALVIFPLVAWLLASAERLSDLYSGFTIPEWMSIGIGLAMLAAIFQRLRRAHALAVEPEK